MGLKSELKRRKADAPFKRPKPTAEADAVLAPSRDQDSPAWITKSVISQTARARRPA
jgi:hypothetical protein